MGRKDTNEIDLERYAEISAGLVGLSDAEAIYAAIAAEGVDRATWDRANERFRRELSRSPDRAARYMELLSAAMAARSGDAPELHMEAYVAATVEAYAGTPTEDVAAGLGLSVTDFTRAGYAWLERMAQDPRLDTEVKLRIQRGVAVRTGEAPKERLRWNPGTRVRRRACFRCGALKVTPPRTSWVYCDYCGTLFDVDATVAAQDRAALDPDTVVDALDAVTSEDLARAFAADDREAYAAVVRWRTALDMDVSPETYSPRIGDPAYRGRLLDVTVDWEVTIRWNADLVAQMRGLDRTERRALSGLRPERILEHLRASRATWESELRVLTEAGILARHPDDLDAEMLLHVKGAQFCRRWLPFLSGKADIERLLEEAGVASQYVEAPFPDFRSLTCGQCASRVEVPEGARKKVCEACGYVLDLEGRIVPCTHCGAGVSMAAGQTERLEYDCAYCGGRFAL